MHFNYQNLNEKRNGKKGWLLRHGRAWVGFGKEYGSTPKLRCEWSAPTHFFHIGFSFREPFEDTAQFHFACGLFAIWLTLEARWAWLPQNRRCEISFHHWTIWVHPWSKAHEWTRSDPWWVRGFSINLPDLFLGRAKHSEESFSTHEVVVPLPEGSYPATVRMFESTWKRPRWFARRLLRAEINVPSGIPHDGKGESSWDCGEDATYGLTCCADSKEDAIGKLVASVLTSRRKHGAARDLVPVLSHRVTQQQVNQPIT